MSNTPTDPVIEEIIEAAQNEIEALRSTITRSGNATHQLETIQQRIELGIERNSQLAESLIALNEHMQQLATGIQALQVDKMVAQIESTSVAIENEILSGIAALPDLIETRVDDVKATINQRAEDSRAQVTASVSSCRKILIAAVALSALTLIATVLSIIL